MDVWQVWTNYDAARWRGVRDLAHEKLYPLLTDDIPEVCQSSRHLFICLTLTLTFGVCFLYFETAHLNRIFWIVNAVLAGVLSDTTLPVYCSNVDQSEWSVQMFPWPNRWVDVCVLFVGSCGRSLCTRHVHEQLWWTRWTREQHRPRRCCEAAYCSLWWISHR